MTTRRDLKTEREFREMLERWWRRRMEEEMYQDEPITLEVSSLRRLVLPVTKKPLEWGETPWDAMPRGELEREVQRLYAACGAARGALAMCRHGIESSPYWGRGGTGGDALAMTEQALAPHDGDDRYRESVYRSFFRYAVDLLFDGLGFGWKVCESCGVMLGDRVGEPTPAPRVCIANKCGGQMRPIAWDDLKRERRVP